MHRRETFQKHLAFKSLKVYYFKKKALSIKTEKVLKNYGARLMLSALTAFKDMIELKRDVSYAMAQARKYFMQRRIQKVFRVMKEYAEWKAGSRFAVQWFREQKTTANKRIVFVKLAKNLHKQQLIAKVKPLQTRIELDIKSIYFDRMYNLAKKAMDTKKFMFEFSRMRVLRQKAFFFGLLSQHAYQ